MGYHLNENHHQREPDAQEATPPTASSIFLQKMRTLLGLRPPGEDERSFSELVSALAHPLWTTRVAALRGLERLGRRDTPSDPLLKALHDPEPLVRATAAQALGIFGDSAPIFSLEKACRDSD